MPFNFIFPSYSCAKYVLRCILVSAIWIQSFKCMCFEIYIYTKYEASIIYSHFSGYFIGRDLPCLIQPPAVCSYFNVNDFKRNKCKICSLHHVSTCQVLRSNIQLCGCHWTVQIIEYFHHWRKSYSQCWSRLNAGGKERKACSQIFFLPNVEWFLCFCLWFC